MKKYLMAGCLLALMLNGCDSSKSVSSIVSHGSEVDGYKAFKFGMSPLQVASLPECSAFNVEIEENKKLNDKDIKALQEIKDKRQKMDIEDLSHLDERIKDIEDNFVNMVPTNSSEEYAKEKKLARLAELKAQRTTGHSDLPTIIPFEDEDTKILNENIKNRVVVASNESVLNWFKSGKSCVAEIFGKPTNVWPRFDKQNQLFSVGLYLGEFNDATFQSVVQKLSEKYSMSYQYTPEQLEAFNLSQLDTIKVTFEDGQIEAVVDNQENGRIMSLFYNSKLIANKVNKTATKGKVNSDDL